MDNADDLFRRFLEKQNASGGKRLSDAEIRHFVEGQLDHEYLEDVLERLSQNPTDHDLVAAVRKRLETVSEAEKESVSEKLIRRAATAPQGRLTSSACPHCGGPITPFKSSPAGQRAVIWFWGALCLGGFMASFVFRGYFFQCLAVSILAGFKWALDARALKAQILIYRALSSTDTELHRRDLQRDDARL